MFESKDLEYHKGKYYGLYRAYVYDNKDPKNLGRLKLQIPNVYGVENGTDMLVTDWAYPMFPTCGNKAGIMCIPPITNHDGTKVLVWVAFEMGDKNKPVWMGGPVSSGGLQSDAEKNHKDKVAGITTKATYTFSSPSGHKVILNDDDGAINIVSAAGHKVYLNDGGEISLETTGGNKVILNDGEGITIESTQETIRIQCGGNKITFDGKAKHIKVNKQTFPQ